MPRALSGANSMSCPNGFTMVREGLAEICVPDPNIYRRSDGVYEPAWAPVFYNPAMVTNRDVVSAFIKAMRELGERVNIAIDAMCGTGVRGIRLVKESDVPRVVMIDVDWDAVSIAQLNARINGVEGAVSVERRDCREYMYMSKRERLVMDFIDIDPFGSPAPYVQAAIETVRGGGFVAFTATDLAPLEGKYPKKLYRRYWVRGRKIGVSKHAAIRNLLAFVARIAAIVDRYVEPLYAYYDRHYVRIYLRIKKGKSRAFECIDKCIGSISYCNVCGFWKMGKEPVDMCPICGSRTEIISGTWICETARVEVARKVLDVIARYSWYSERSKAIAQSVFKEAEIGNVLPYRISLVCRFLKVNMPRISAVTEELARRGYRAVRAWGYHDAIVSDAPLREVMEVVKALSR